MMLSLFKLIYLKFKSTFLVFNSNPLNLIWIDRIFLDFENLKSRGV